MITAIFTGSGRTTLTIETSEAVSFVQMGREENPMALQAGTHHLDVESGVFKVLSNHAVRVTSETPLLYVASTTNSKDDEFPNPPKVMIGSDVLHSFFVDARGQAAPR